MTRNLLLSLFFSICLITSSVSGDIVAQYNSEVSGIFDGQGNSVGMSSDTHGPTTASPYNTRSSEMNPTTRSGIADGNAYINAGATAATTNPGISNGYHQFELTIDQGAWDLDKISFDYWITDTYAGGRFFAHVYTDKTNFDNTGDLLGGYEHVGDSQSTTTHVERVEVDLSSFRAHKNLTAGDSVNFRIYFADYTSSDVREHHIDNIRLEAFRAASIPEPGSAAVIAGALMIAGCRRRRK